jgi:hypothetical protein
MHKAYALYPLKWKDVKLLTGTEWYAINTIQERGIVILPNG